VDGDLAIHGTIEFGRELGESRFGQVCMKFRLSDELKQREAEFGNVPALMGAPLDGEGFSNVIMSGKLSQMRMIAATSCEQGGAAERLDLRALSQGGGLGGSTAGENRGRPRLPRGEGQDTAPLIPGTDIPAGVSDELRPNPLDEGDSEPTGEDVTLDDVQRMGRGRTGTEDGRPTNIGRPDGDRAPRGEPPVNEPDQVERADVEERAEREAEAARREADRLAEEAEEPDGEDSESDEDGDNGDNEE
jgi:hypothetical protein